MTKREAIFPADRHALYTAHRYSAAVRSGDLLFVSGQVGSRADGSPEPDYERQVKLAFENLNAVLKGQFGQCITRLRRRTNEKRCAQKKKQQKRTVTGISRT